MYKSLSFTILAVIIEAFLCLGPSEASEGNQLINEYKNKKEEMVTIEKNQRRVMGNIYTISNKIKNMAKKRDRLVDRGLALKGGIRVMARDIAQLEKKIKESRYALSRRLRAIYIAGGRGALQVIFSSSSAIDLDRNIKFLKLISQRDYEIIKSYQRSLQELEFQRGRLKVKVRKLMLVRSRLHNQEVVLENTQKRKSKILSGLQKRKKDTLGRLRGIRKKSLVAKNLSYDIKKGFQIPIFERKGKLNPPVDVPISKKFGLIISPKYRYILGHKGLYFSAPISSPIKTVFSGKVVFVGDLPGYNRTIIVDHGDHYYSVYGQVSKSFVKSGERIEEGDVVGQVGRGTRYPDPGLYFEVRHFSEAVDPQKWLVSEVRYRKAGISKEIQQ